MKNKQNCISQNVNDALVINRICTAPIKKNTVQRSCIRTRLLPKDHFSFTKKLKGHVFVTYERVNERCAAMRVVCRDNVIRQYELNTIGIANGKRTVTRRVTLNIHIHDNYFSVHPDYIYVLVIQGCIY